MKITIPVRTFEFKIPKGCRKPRYVEEEHELSVNIKEVTRNDVTPAFIVKSYQDADREIISYRGSLYKQVQDRDDNYSNFTEEEQRIKPLFINVPADEHGVVWIRWAIKSSGKSLEESKSELNKRAATLLIVDGMIYQKTGEPYYSPITFGLGYNQGGTSYSIHYAEPQKKKIYGLSPISLEAAREATVKVALDRDDTKSVSLINAAVEEIVVLNPLFIKKTYYYKY